MLSAILGPAIGGITSIIGGILGNSAAKKAAELQAQAAVNAGKTVTDAAAAVNPLITAAATAGGAQVKDAAAAAGGQVLGAVGDANAYLDPYIDSGTAAVTTLGGMLAPGGELTKDFTAADMEAYDPGYQFRIEQGRLALQRAQAATGRSTGGGAAKALLNYGQNAASAEYANAFQRFQSSQQQKYDFQAGVAQMGVNPATTAGSRELQATEYAGTLGMDAAQFDATAGMRAVDTTSGNTLDAARAAAQAEMAAAEAKSAGKMASANAWSGTLGGLAKAGAGADWASIFQKKTAQPARTWV